MIIKKFFTFLKQSIEKMIAKYFFSKTATARSVSAIIGSMTLAFFMIVWIVGMAYAFMHNGVFPRLNDFYYVYIPSVIIVITGVIYYPTSFSLWSKEVSK